MKNRKGIILAEKFMKTEYGVYLKDLAEDKYIEE